MGNRKSALYQAFKSRLKKNKEIKILILNFHHAPDLFILETTALPRHTRNDPKHISPYFQVCFWQKCFYESALKLCWCSLVFAGKICIKILH